VPFALGRLVGQGTEFAALVLFARHLGPDDFGRLLTCLLAGRYVGLVGDWGAMLRGARDVARRDWPTVRAVVRRRTAVGITLALALIAVVAVVEPWLATIAGAAALNRSLQRDWISLGLERSGRAAVPVALQGLLVLAGAVALDGRSAAALSFTVAYGIGLVASLALNRLPTSTAGDAHVDAWLLGGVLADQVSQTADVLLLSGIKGAGPAGVYAAAYRIPSALNTIVGLAINGLVPVLANTLHADPDREPVLRRRLLRWSVAAGVAVACLAPVLAATVEPIYGREFRSGAGPAAVLVIAVALATAAAPLHALCLARGLDRPYAWVLMAGGGVNLVGNILVIPSHGPVGAAFVTLASTTVVQAGVTWATFIRRRTAA
jgi:O-antigen/teichoic acid export membrane protein